MRKILFSLIALAALTFDAGAQWTRPAREVRATTNTWTFIPTTNNTSQKVYDWLDDYLVWADPIIRGSILDGSSWANLPDTNAVQSVFDWIDSNWPTNIDLAEVYVPGSNIVGATRSGHNWTLPASGVPVSTSSWDVLNPADTNAQAAFNAIDDWAGYVNSNLNVATVAGAAQLVYNNGFGFTGAEVPTQNVGSLEVVFWTNGTHSATAANTNVLAWGTGGDAGRLIVKRAGTYWFYAAVNAITLGPAYSYIYWVQYDAATNWVYASPVAGSDGYTNSPLQGAGVHLAIDANAGDFVRLETSVLSTFTNRILLGSQYIFAYKVYNED